MVEIMQEYGVVRTKLNEAKRQQQRMYMVRSAHTTAEIMQYAILFVRF